MPVESLTSEITNSLVDLKADPLSVLSDAAPNSPLADFSPSPMTARVEFSGLSSTNARRIVYIIDASGSMIRSLQIVIKELARSIDALSTQQRFGVVFFQSDDAVIVPPKGELTIGSGPEKLRMDRPQCPSARQLQSPRRPSLCARSETRCHIRSERKHHRRRPARNRSA
jgi:hypothetical protein